MNRFIWVVEFLTEGQIDWKPFGKEFYLTKATAIVAKKHIEIDMKESIERAGMVNRIIKRRFRVCKYEGV